MGRIASINKWGNYLAGLYKLVDFAAFYLCFYCLCSCTQLLGCSHKASMNKKPNPPFFPLKLMRLETDHISKFHATPPVKLRRHVKLQEKKLGRIIWSDCTFKQQCVCRRVLTCLFALC